MNENGLNHDSSFDFDTFLEKTEAVRVANRFLSNPILFLSNKQPILDPREQMYSYTNLIYKDVFGKNITGDNIAYKFDDDEYRDITGELPSGYKPDISPKSSFIEVKVDKSKVNYKNGNCDDPIYRGGSYEDRLIKQLGENEHNNEHNATKSDTEIINYMNDTLKLGNPLFDKIDVNKDGHLSGTEIQDYFDRFKHKGTTIYHCHPANWACMYPRPTYPTADTNKISVADLTNIYALKHNAIITDTLFSENNNLSYEDIGYKSIITKDDFDLLDKADGTADEVISKDTFAKFGFDKNGDGIIDQDEYKEGMSRVKEVVANSVGYEHGAIQKEFDNQPPQVQQFMPPLKVPEYMELCVDEHNHNMVKGDFDFDQNGDEIIGNNEYMKSCIKESIDKLSHEEGAGYDMTTKEPNNQPSQYQQSIPDEHKMQ